MIRKFLAIVIAATLMGAALPSTAAPTPKAGAACSQIGQKKVLGDKTFTCVKSGKKKVWNKGLATEFAYSPRANEVGNWCDPDPTIKGFGAELQRYLQSSRGCVGPMRIVPATIGTKVPKVLISNPSVLEKSEVCKLEKPPITQYGVWKGFPSASERSVFDRERHPSPKTILQIAPIYSIDAPVTSNSPAEDYKFYLDFVKTYFDYINDGPGGIEIRVPSQYFKFEGEIAKFGVRHGVDGPLSDQFIQKAISAVDEYVDFTEVNFTLVVLPAGTPSGVIAQNGFGRGAATAEKQLTNLAVAQPATVSGPNNSVTPYFSAPALWLHEFYHPGLNLGDNHAGESANYDSNRGMGHWGLMSNVSGDMLVWQKWLLGFLQDSQVRCLTKDLVEPTTHWLAPSSVKTTNPKMLVLKISPSKALIVESIRANGLNYRFGKNRLGALIYEIDVADTGHFSGYTVMYPDSRRPNPSASWQKMEDASLKLGESLTYAGLKITNVEWGDFGDVIKVEKVAN